MKTSRRVLRLWILGVGVLLAATAGAEEIKIDKYEVGDASTAKDRTIAFRDFSMENTDFGKMKKDSQRQAVEVMRGTAPIAFREAFAQRLREDGVFAGVEVLGPDADVPDGALVVQGEFTELNPGSRTKRYMVGLGAGRSKICIAGRVLDPAGETLVKFEDCRSGTMGWFGGRSEGMMSQDVYLAARNLADFLSSWAEGKVRTTATDNRPQ